MSCALKGRILRNLVKCLWSPESPDVSFKFSVPLPVNIHTQWSTRSKQKSTEKKQALSRRLPYVFLSFLETCSKAQLYKDWDQRPRAHHWIHPRSVSRLKCNENQSICFYSWRVLIMSDKHTLKSGSYSVGNTANEALIKIRH